MKIYKVEAYVKRNIEDLDIELDIEDKFDEEGNALSEEKQEEIKNKIIQNYKSKNPSGKYTSKERFYISGYSLADAMFEAMDRLEKVYDENDFDIYVLESLKEEDGGEIEVLENCECPFCSYETASPDNKMIFKCGWCEEELKVSDGWKTIECSNDECQGEIHRECVIVSANGSYVHRLDLEDDYEEDQNKDHENSKEE
jgi:hypothetical protein